MITEEKRDLDRLARIVDKVINRYFDRLGIDRSCFEFKLTCNIISTSEDNVLDTYVLIDDSSHPCCFCTKSTSYFDKVTEKYLCPSCYSMVYNHE